jgi:hypothetical protein
MAELSEKIAENVGELSEGFRRRLTAGIILLGSFTYPWLTNSNISVLAGQDSLLTSPVFAIVFISLAYISGGLVEMAGEVLLARLVGNYLWAFMVPFTWVKDFSPRFRYLLCSIFCVPGGIILAYYYVGRALLGWSDFRWPNALKALSAGARDYFESLPECVKAGLLDPFGNHQELAWLFLQDRAEPIGARWLRSLENRNREVFAVLSALMLAGMMYMIVSHDIFLQNLPLSAAFQISLLLLFCGTGALSDST